MFEFLQNEVTFYLLCGLLGLAASIIVVCVLIRNRNVTKSRFIALYACAAAGLFVGGHFFFFLVGLPDYIRDVVPTLKSFYDFVISLGMASSGMVFYGGLLFGLLFMYIYCKCVKLPIRHYLNIMVVTCPLFHCFGRIGCALSGCCYGIEYHGPLAILYNESFVTPGVNEDLVDFPRFPVQLLEALLELILFIVLLLIYLKKEDTFSVTATYLLVYPIIRFFDEFLRGDMQRGIWGPLSTSQWISLVIFIITLIYLIVQRNRSKKELPLG
ncbi:MAG: prolipoprotein diacylglyceryl transferase [Lachnospiraceae bacterium]|nr:prolipoprotein diacylglyceryl transferase [Lachnospiraceae bacterium]